MCLLALGQPFLCPSGMCVDRVMGLSSSRRMGYRLCYFAGAADIRRFNGSHEQRRGGNGETKLGGPNFFRSAGAKHSECMCFAGMGAERMRGKASMAKHSAYMCFAGIGAERMRGKASMEGRVSLWRRPEGARRKRATGGQAHNHAFDGSVSIHPARLGVFPLLEFGIAV